MNRIASSSENPHRASWICAPRTDGPDKKIRRRKPPADGLARLLGGYAFMLAFTASAVIGSERTRAPQALKIALASAGATTVTAGSPTPVAFSPLAMTLTATSGVWLIRNGV